MSAELIMFAVVGLYLITSVLEDFGYINSVSWVWHSADATGRALIIGYVCYTIYGLTVLAAIVTVDILTLWWIVFDIALNIKRGDRVFYVGSGTMDLAAKALARKIGIGVEQFMFVVKLLTVILMGFVTYLFN
jgi:hypothetical protein